MRTLSLQTDPFWTASSLSPSDRREAQNQSICSLAELLELAKGNATLLLNLRDPPREHPYRGSFLNVTLEALLRSGFPQHQVRARLPVQSRPPARTRHTCPWGPQPPHAEGGGGVTLAFLTAASSWGREGNKKVL